MSSALRRAGGWQVVSRPDSLGTNTWPCQLLPYPTHVCTRRLPSDVAIGLQSGDAFSYTVIATWSVNTGLLQGIKYRKRTGCTPSIIISGGSYSTTSKYSLALDEHLLPGWEDGAIGDHQVLRDSWARDDNEQLVPEPYWVQVAKFLGPFIEGTLWVVSQEWKRA